MPITAMPNAECYPFIVQSLAVAPAKATAVEINPAKNMIEPAMTFFIYLFLHKSGLGDFILTNRMIV